MPRRVAISSKDRRLLRRGAAITLYLWTLILVAFLSGSVLPFAASGILGSGRVIDPVGIGIVASLVFAALFGSASFFLPERAMPRWGRTILGLTVLVFGVLALATSVAIVRVIGVILSAAQSWALGAVADRKSVV